MLKFIGFTCKDAYERDQEDAIIEAQSGQKAVKQMAEDIREEIRKLTAIPFMLRGNEVPVVVTVVSMLVVALEEAILLKIRSQNERREKKQQKVKEQREQHRRALLQDGKNPYEVWRREEMKERKEEQRLRSWVDVSLTFISKSSIRLVVDDTFLVLLMEQLIIEDGTYKHKIQEEKRKREQADEFQRQVGNYAKEQKITRGDPDRTAGNVDVLDPTGTALRIDPSKVSIQKSNAFGLGRARTEEIQRVEQQDLTVQARITTAFSEHGTSPIEQWKEAQLPNEEEELAEALRLEQEQQLQQEEEEVDEVQVPGVASQHVKDEEEFDEDEDLVEQKLWVPNYSKLEMQYMAAARICQGWNFAWDLQMPLSFSDRKEFKGDAFLAKPAVIAFNDFEVGKRYRQVIEVTNVSLTFNQKDFFEINFVPPGRMSAGVTRYITLWFVPKVSQDIVSTFPILAKTGRIDFPLRCTTKKTILTITPQELVIKNTGALSADFNVLRRRSSEDEGICKLGVLSLLCDMRMTWLEKGICKSLGSTKIGFKFVPTRLRISNGAPGTSDVHETVRVQYLGRLDGIGIANIRAMCIGLAGIGEAVYGGLGPTRYDMHTCVYGHIFRESVMIRNRGSVAMKIQVQKPTQIEGELQLNTALAYIQGYASQAIQVKLIPKADFLDRHPEFRDAQRPDVPGAFRIPMRIIGADQVLPVNTCLIGTLTTDAMTFLPGELNFGPCLVGTSAVRAAAWGGLDAKPGTIAVTCRIVACGEKRQVSVLYTPESAIVITGDLCVRDFATRPRIRSLEFSETQLDLASIPADAATKDSIVVRNVSKVPQMLNALLPPFELSGLKMTPICFTLQPKESQRLQEYVDLLKMPVEEKPEAPEDGAAAPPDGDEAPAEEPGEMDAEEYSKLAQNP
ncbi:hypothetical protein AK812_SmicGene18312 [Symbiodinium microadriaticum]|uniref:CFAP74 third Ig-like domain-containing protein n=1 Tax=Symbiodinium microadriaticum TaxID=2951 RepID=A0A1Q9DVG6_SYMMI|nr:hypothetical protein AK812_SmicGene18312 [Symbiodinium microadriaticum]